MLTVRSYVLFSYACADWKIWCHLGKMCVSAHTCEEKAPCDDFYSSMVTSSDCVECFLEAHAPHRRFTVKNVFNRSEEGGPPPAVITSDDVLYAGFIQPCAYEQLQTPAPYAFCSICLRAH